MKKAAAKKKARKTVKKVLTKKKAALKSKPKVNPIKPIGKVVHYYGNIKVAVVKFNKDIKNGSNLQFKGATTDFKKMISSMQIDHKPCKNAKKGKQIGIKVGKKVRVGDLIYAVK